MTRENSTTSVVAATLRRRWTADARSSLTNRENTKRDGIKYIKQAKEQKLKRGDDDGQV